MMAAVPSPVLSRAELSADYQELKSGIHQALLNRLNLDRLAEVRREEGEPEIRSLIVGMLDGEYRGVPLSTAEREGLIGDVFNELFGLGPLEPLLRDSDISDILVNRFDRVYIERNGRLEEAHGVTFKDDRHLERIIERIVSSVGRRIDESHPMVDARLLDGSRVNAIILELLHSTTRTITCVSYYLADPKRRVEQNPQQYAAGR